MNDQLSSARVVEDLVCIHKERISSYKQILHQFSDIELDLKAIIERIIEESMNCTEQLKERILANTGAEGEIYRSWVKMKKPLAGPDKKTILAMLADDELIMTNTYSMALSLVTEPHLVKLLEQQQLGLKKLHLHIRQYHNAQ